MVRCALLDAVANVLCPACKLWNTGHGANTMREAVSLMGGYGITEDCPGFLGHKWMDSQLEATYEGPEAVQRRQLSVTMADELFLAQFRQLDRGPAQIAGTRPGTGACTLATAMEMWLWTLHHLQDSNDADGAKLYHSSRQAVTFALADALCWLLASRAQILDLLELEEKGPQNPAVAEALPGARLNSSPISAMCKPRARPAKWAASAPSWCSAISRHPAWDSDACRTCYQSERSGGAGSADARALLAWRAPVPT